MPELLPVLLFCRTVCRFRWSRVALQTPLFCDQIFSRAYHQCWLLIHTTTDKVHTCGTLSSGKKRLTALKRYCIGPLKRDRPGSCPQSIVSASCVEAKTLAVRAFLRATRHSTRRRLNSIDFIGGLLLSGWLGAPQPPMSPPAGGSAARPGFSAPLQYARPSKRAQLSP